MKDDSCKLIVTFSVPSLTALLAGEKLPPDAEIDVSSIFVSFNLSRIIRGFYLEVLINSQFISERSF